MKRRIRAMGCTALTALLIALATEILGRSSLGDAARFAMNAPGHFLFNALIIFATLTWATLFRRSAAAFVLIGVLWLTLGAVNCVVIHFRSVPFAMSDALLLPEAIKLMGVYFTPVQSALILAAAALVLVGLVVLFFRAKKRPRVPWRFSLPYVAVSTLAAALVMAVGGYTGWLDTKFENVIDTYHSEGFAYSLVYTIGDLGMERPADYSPDAVEEIADALEGSPEPVPAQRPSIVFLQLESFADPDLLLGVETGQEAVPTFTRLKDTCPSGRLHMPMVGGGTVNCEFEVLTGMCTDFFGVGEYPYNTILREVTSESVAYALKEYGYRACFIHNFSGSFYNRHLVLPQLGFDVYDSVEYMPGLTYNPLEWPEDRVLTGEILLALESTPQRDFIFLTTMQCHGPYPEAPICETAIPVTVTDERYNPSAVAYYVDQLHATDAFLAELLAALERWPEPVVLLVYGDHLPALELEADMTATGDLFTTEYALWANFPLEAPDEDMEAYQIAAHVLHLLDMDAGIMTKYHQLRAGEPDYLEKLELLQYDMLYGEQEVFGGTSPYLPTHLTMGLRPIRATRAWEENGRLVVEGENFTPSSQVFVNGEGVETRFVSDARLEVDTCPAEGKVSVAQVSREALVLSQTEEISMTQGEE